MLPLVPVLAVAGAAAWLSTNEHGQAPGAVATPDAEAPTVQEKRPPPEPYVPSSPQGPRAGGDPPPADPLVQVTEQTFDAVTGEAVQVGKDAVAGAGAVLLGGGTIGEATGAFGSSISAAASSVSGSASSAASGAAGVVGPAVVVAADVLMVAGAFYDMFGGDLSNFVPTNAAGLSDAQMAQWHASGDNPMELARIEGRTGQKEILVDGNYVTLGQNALTRETAAQARARIADEMSDVTRDPVTHRVLGVESFEKR